MEGGGGRGLVATKRKKKIETTHIVKIKTYQQNHFELNPTLFELESIWETIQLHRSCYSGPTSFDVRCLLLVHHHHHRLHHHRHRCRPRHGHVLRPSLDPSCDHFLYFPCHCDVRADVRALPFVISLLCTLAIELLPFVACHFFADLDVPQG